MSIGGKGDPPLNPLHVLSNLLIPCRLPSPPSPWNVLDTAQRIGGLATTGPRSLVRAIRGTTPSRSSRRGRHASWRDFAGTPRTGHPCTPGGRCDAPTRPQPGAPGYLGEERPQGSVTRPLA